MFAGALPARDFLLGLNGELTRAVTSACAQIALSRREALLAQEQTL